MKKLDLFLWSLIVVGMVAFAMAFGRGKPAAGIHPNIVTEAVLKPIAFIKSRRFIKSPFARILNLLSDIFISTL